jgi:hypothetical protein
VRELRYALVVDGNTIEEEVPVDEPLMISVCTGLATFGQESNVIRLVQYTTEEDFEPKLLGKYPGRRTGIAMTCLTYFSLDAFKVGYTSNDKQMEARLKELPLP